MSELLDLAQYRRERDRRIYGAALGRSYARAVGADLWLPEPEVIQAANLPAISEMADRRASYRERIEARRQLVLTGDSFNPAGVVSCWLRNNTLSGLVASVPDLINTGNPALQSQSTRRPDGLADGSMQFTTNDALVWPLTAANNGTLYWLWAGWVKHDGAAVVAEAYVTIEALTNGASADKIRFTRHSGGGAMRVDVYFDGVNGRRFNSSNNFNGTTPMFLTCEFNATASGEANQLVVTVDTVVQSGAFSNLNVPVGTMSDGLSPGVTGNMIIGNRRDAATGASSFNGRKGGNQFFGAVGPMPGVTQGLLTPAARTALMGIEPLAA